MSNNFDVSTVSRRRFLAVAGSVAAASSLAVGSDGTSAQPSSVHASPAHYLVTIDATTDPISYSALNIDTNMNVPMPNNSLTVNQGDEVKWQARTTPPNPKHRAKVRFTTTTPFTVQEFKWSENQSAGANTQSTGSFYYCVAVFDKATQEVYADDPKIIVGGTYDAKTEVVEAESELREVKEKIGSIENLLRKAVEKL